MPFIVQCPHTDCRKYMLLEDSVRGAKVECLVCRQAIQVEPSGSSQKRQQPPPRPSAASTPTTQSQQIADCPNCGAPLRLPPAHQGRPIRCPRCSHVFSI